MSANEREGRYALECFIERIHPSTGEPLAEPIRPEELLVRSHRDFHPVDVHAHFMMSRVVRSTGSVGKALQRWRQMRGLAWRASAGIAWLLRHRDPDRVARWLFGLERVSSLFRFRRHPLPVEVATAGIERARRRAEAALRAAREGDGIRVLLTGGTGFLGQELIAQAVRDPAIAELIVVIRPREVRDRATGDVVDTIAPERRGARLLRRLGIDGGPQADRVHFVTGDIEEADLGLDPITVDALARRVTHVVHCAASVAFDAPYERSFRANVEGSRRALALSEKLSAVAGSPFVAHLSIETSYIHGRQIHDRAREDAMVFPSNYYNNYYELTKAMASIETERFIVERQLRVVELCPAIVIGESRAGNNRGDTKVVNAPVNVFGRAHQALSQKKGGLIERSSASMIARMACIFPGDPSAEINLIPVDRVVAGIIAGLKKPEAMGRRIHLGTDNRVTSKGIVDIVKEELGVEVRLADPTMHRNVTLPVLTKLLAGVKQERLGKALEKLGSIFGSYSEWGQPVHEVGRDVELLGLSPERPNTHHAFRMLCRHNRYVQNFGQVRDLDEISRREKVWWDFCLDLEERTGSPVGAMSAEDFRRAVDEDLDLETFERRA